MSLEKKIMVDIKNAMKAKDKTALEALRAVKTAITLLKTEKKGADISEKDEISILQKQIKMRKDAAEQFAAQGRDEMAENEENQAEVISKYLPKQLSEEELAAEISAIIEKVGAKEMKDMGKVMGLANQVLAGKADGKSISVEVKKQLGL